MLNAFPDGRHHDPAPHEEDHHDGGGDLVGSVAEVPGAAPAVGIHWKMEPNFLVKGSEKEI